MKRDSDYSATTKNQKKEGKTHILASHFGIKDVCLQSDIFSCNSRDYIN